MQNLEKPALPLREAIERLEARLASPAFIEGLRDQEFWFDNLVENGAFDLSTAGWALTAFSPGSSQSIVAGRYRITMGGGDANARGYQGIATVPGATYFYSVDGYQGTSAADPQFKIGTSAGGSDILTRTLGSADGTYSGLFTATAKTTYLTAQNNSSGDGDYVEFDNVSAFLTDGTDIIHRMPTGWKPRRVFVDGVLQREGATHDYEVKQDPEGYYIVPAVAPGANTETCILGVKA